MSVVCIIPARGGSKGLAHKNIIEIDGRPLLAHTILHAKSAEIDHIYVSTDSDKISVVAEEYGAEVIDRPAELALDLTTTEDTLAHALCYIESRVKPTAVVYMSCCQPYREVEWIRICIDKVVNQGYDSAFIGYETHKNYWMKSDTGYDKIYWEKYTSRQTRRPVIQENTGTVCVTLPEFIYNKSRIGTNVYIHTVDKFNLDIHDTIDAEIANLLLKYERYN